MDIAKYSLVDFMEKFSGKRHISAGIHYTDGTVESVMNVSYSQVMSAVDGKDVAYIVTKG